YADLGVATSGATLFRLIGGALGTAVFGAIFAGRLNITLREASAASGLTIPRGHGMGPDAIAALDPAVRTLYIDAFTRSLSIVFAVAAGIAVAGFILTCFVPERPLRETIAASAQNIGREAGDLFPMPTDASSVARLEQSLSLLAFRHTQRAYIEEFVRRA